MTNEWSTPQWHAMHGADRYASVLVMVRAALISREAISVAHHIPGRIMQVRLQLYRPHDIYAVYQHAWHSGGNISQLLNKRKRVWTCLRDCISHTPARNLLLLGGDYNTPLDFDGQHVFTQDIKYAKAAQTDRALFQTLVQDHNLAAVHTRVFHPTFVHGDHNARIDFVLTRKEQISWRTLQPKHHPDFDFLFGNQGPRHYPLSLHLSKWFPTPNPENHEGINRFRLRQAWTQHTPQWAHFLTQARQVIAAHGPSLSPIDRNLTLERSLVQICKNCFPSVRQQAPLDPAFRSLTAQMWLARKAALALHDRSVKSVFQGWFNLTRYRTLHKRIRQYSRTNKRTRLEAFLREGADLAMRHQSFDFFRRIRTLCPKQRLQRIHMFDSHGQPLSPQQELDELVQYFGTQFHDPDFLQPDLPPLQVLPFDEDAVYEALRRMPATKAVAPPSLPAIVWKALAPELASSTYHALAHWWSVNPPQAPDDWTAGWLHLIPKPGKPSTKPQALRPICLQHPVCKVASSFVTTQLLQYSIDKLRRLPLYAYLPNWSTADCLLRVSHHCRQVRDDCQLRSKDNSADGMFAGLQVSLDMNKAFDSVSRNTVSLAIKCLHLPHDLQTMIHTLLSPHKYYIPHKKFVGEILATRGIRQGSKDGPILWTLCVHLVLADLAARYSCTWLHDHVIIHADDVHLRWSTQRLSDGLTAISDLDHILRVFRLYGFTINLDKSVVLFRAVGKGASRFTKRWVIRTKTGPFLTMPDSST